jgi:hypothetical protein
MEPTDLSFSDRKADGLETLLREPAPVLSDNGFSARVIAALSSTKPVRRWKARAVFCVMGALAGGLIMGSRFNSAAEAKGDFIRLDVTLDQIASAFAPLADPMIVTGLVLAAGSVAFALWIGDRRRSWW